MSGEGDLGFQLAAHLRRAVHLASPRRLRPGRAWGRDSRQRRWCCTRFRGHRRYRRSRCPRECAVRLSLIASMAPNAVLSLTATAVGRCGWARISCIWTYPLRGWPGRRRRLESGTVGQPMTSSAMVWPRRRSRGLDWRAGEAPMRVWPSSIRWRVTSRPVKLSASTAWTGWRRSSRPAPAACGHARCARSPRR